MEYGEYLCGDPEAELMVEEVSQEALGLHVELADRVSQRRLGAYASALVGLMLLLGGFGGTHCRTVKPVMPWLFFALYAVDAAWLMTRI